MTSSFDTVLFVLLRYLAILFFDIAVFGKFFSAVLRCSEPPIVPLYIFFPFPFYQITFIASIAPDIKEQSGHCGRLPDQTDLVGRNETCENIITALSSNKACEIVAPPGYGKTSVVIEVGHRMIKRGKFVAYVKPRGVTCVEDLASKIIEALGFDPGEDTITEAIRRISALKTKTVVLIIENIDNLLHLEDQVSNDEYHQ